MKITTIAENPHLYRETMALIEKSFNYKGTYSFEIDFYPLVNKSNHSNCYILLDDEKVIGHIGLLEKAFTYDFNFLKVSFIGGIAIDEDYRGKGLFSQFFNEIINKHSDSAFHILWSDQIDLYKKFNFHPAFKCIQYPKSQTSSPIRLEQTRYKDLTPSEKEEIKIIYENADIIKPLRSNEDWEAIEMISTSDLYIQREENKILNYCFINKGQDLTNIIHEYGEMNKDFFCSINTIGTVWTTKEKLNENFQAIFGALIKINNKDRFQHFVLNYSPFKEIKTNDEHVEFKFKDEEFKLSHSDFLSGIFGPGRFEEMNSPEFYIPGLDSI